MVNEIMETFTLSHDLKVFGFQVKDFPSGIGEAFDKLVNMIPGGFDRPYYGISEMCKEGMVYRAVALENYEGEAETYHCERFIIEKGEYAAVTLLDWRKNLGSIKEIFHEMHNDPHVDKTKSCVEWYKNDDEMVCMMKLKPKINGHQY